MNTAPTLICAYCNAARQPGHPCPCGVQQATGAARTCELARHREAFHSSLTVKQSCPACGDTGCTCVEHYGGQP